MTTMVKTAIEGLGFDSVRVNDHFSEEVSTDVRSAFADLDGVTYEAVYFDGKSEHKDRLLIRAFESLKSRLEG